MIPTHGANSISRGDGDFVEIGGHRYPVVKIGNQLWTSENLDYIWSDLVVGTDVRYYNDDPTTYGIDGPYKCGLLYIGRIAILLEQNKTVLLPSGWRVPSLEDWTELINLAGGDTVAGLNLKAQNNTIISNWPSGWNGSDTYGFNILPAGSYNGGYGWLGSYSGFWSSTSDGPTRQINCAFDTSDYSYLSSDISNQFISLRLIKDVA